MQQHTIIGLCIILIGIFLIVFRKTWTKGWKELYKKIIDADNIFLETVGLFGGVILIIAGMVLMFK